MNNNVKGKLSYIETCVVVYVANRRSRPERKEKAYAKEDNKN